MTHNPHALLYLVVRRILSSDTPFSRNQNFEAYNDTLVRQARRIATLLERVQRSVLSLDEPERRLVLLRETSHGEVSVGIHGTHVRVEHTLNSAQWEVLCEQPDVVSVLRAHLCDLQGLALNEARAVLGEPVQG